MRLGPSTTVSRRTLWLRGAGAAAAVPLLLIASTVAAAHAQARASTAATPRAAIVGVTAATPSVAAPLPGVGGGLDASVSLVVSTLGYGAEFNKLLTSHVSVRVGGYLLGYSPSATVEDVDYDGKIKFRSAAVLADLYPFSRGSFHFSAGVVSGSNEITAVGVPAAGGVYTINGTEYSTAEVNSLHAKATFPSTRPYAGLGWGSPAKHGFHFTSDLGVVFGKPTYELTTTGPGAPTLQADVDAERQKIQDDFDKFAKLYPVIRAGLTYAF